MHSVSYFLASVFYNKINPAVSVQVRSQGYVFLKGPKNRFTQGTVLGNDFYQKAFHCIYAN